MSTQFYYQYAMDYIQKLFNIHHLNGDDIFYSIKNKSLKLPIMGGYVYACINFIDGTLKITDFKTRYGSTFHTNMGKQCIITADIPYDYTDKMTFTIDCFKDVENPIIRLEALGDTYDNILTVPSGGMTKAYLNSLINVLSGVIEGAYLKKEQK